MECPCDPTGGLEHVRGTDNGTASERAGGRPAAPHRLSHPRLARGQLAQRGGAERVHGQRAGVRTIKRFTNFWTESMPLSKVTLRFSMASEQFRGRHLPTWL